MHMTRMGFMIELTLYGHRWGRPNTAMSVWPSTSTSCWRYTISVVAGVHRLHLAGVDAGHGVGRLDGLEDRAAQARRGHRQALGHAQVGGPVPGRPLPLAPLQKRHLVGEGVVVERGLDLEHLDAAGRDEPAHTPVGRMQLGVLLVHEGAGVAHGLDVVVVAQAAVAGQARWPRSCGLRPWPPG